MVKFTLERINSSSCTNCGVSYSLRRCLRYDLMTFLCWWKPPLLATTFEIASQSPVGIWDCLVSVIPSIESLCLFCAFESYPSGHIYVPGPEQCDYFAALHPVYPVVTKSKGHGLVNGKHYVDRFSLPNSLRPSKLRQLTRL